MQEYEWEEKQHVIIITVSLFEIDLYFIIDLRVLYTYIHPAYINMYKYTK